MSQAYWVVSCDERLRQPYSDGGWLIIVARDFGSCHDTSLRAVSIVIMPSKFHPAIVTISIATVIAEGCQCLQPWWT